MSLNNSGQNNFVNCWAEKTKYNLIHIEDLLLIKSATVTMAVKLVMNLKIFFKINVYRDEKDDF